jgi:hypothetical protein
MQEKAPSTNAPIVEKSILLLAGTVGKEPVMMATTMRVERSHALIVGRLEYLGALVAMEAVKLKKQWALELVDKHNRFVTLREVVA